MADRLYGEASDPNASDAERDNVRRTMAGYYELARRHLPERRRVLDIGCDRGLLLEVARADGFEELHGIEPNPVAREAASAIQGARISGRFYEEVDYPPASFSLVTLVHVLDHVVDPAATLRRAYRHLCPGGIILAVVHNVESLLARLMGERFPVFNLYHLYFFSMRSLDLLFRNAGFAPLFVGRTSNRYSLAYLAERAPGLPRRLRTGLAAGLAATPVGRLAVTLPLGNIGIVARRPPGTGAQHGGNLDG